MQLSYTMSLIIVGLWGCRTYDYFFTVNFIIVGLWGCGAYNY
ncbi:hypothetical protein [Methanobrevibacter boviskoreani]|nr:hypothetical protein [Methanobrevibacter boviskoreani]MDD6255965.1 hypothetical protein [Methanobrevibacter boviskoreani]MDY5614752.1 hypothetical protein [Methanobrevibacter boviskoreani]